MICAVSREYEVSSGKIYWFAFHPHQKAKLEAAAEPFVAFGCASPDKVVLIPFKEFAPWLGGMNQTHRDDDSFYWHNQIFDERGRLILHRRKGEAWPDITEYLIPSGSGESTQAAPKVGNLGVISERNKRGESA